jgi:hypothetical protein
MDRPTYLPTRWLAAGFFLAAAGAASAADAPAAAPAAAAASAPAAARPSAPDTPPTRQALETLLGALPPQAPGQTEGPIRVRVTALRGETVDAVIRRTMGDMPFKENFLRGVFLELNAAAVQPGTTRLIVGSQLQVPHLEDLRSHLQRLLGPSQSAGTTAPASAAADKRHWVRFP